VKRFYVKREILCICRVQTMFKNYWVFMGLFGPWVPPHNDQTSSKFRPKLEAFLLKNKLKISMDKAIKHIMRAKYCFPNDFFQYKKKQTDS